LTSEPQAGQPASGDRSDIDLTSKRGQDGDHWICDLDLAAGADRCQQPFVGLNRKQVKVVRV
jgi:hypothetical protein